MRMRVCRRLGAAGAFAIALVVGVTALPSEARAACAAGSPSPSANHFVGTVVRLGADDRQAYVQKEDGSTVEVDGGTINGGASGEDYHFVLGGRYEIDPDPGESQPPFFVNDCSATTLLSVVSPSPSTSATAPASAAVPSPIGSAPASAELTVFPTASARPDFVTAAIFVFIFALLLAVAYAVRVLRRRLHRWD